jgi:hypothetical protein
MSPVKPRSSSKPIPIEHRPQRVPTPVASIDTQCGPCTCLGSFANVFLHHSKTIKTYPVLPHDLANDIQQFVESDFAKRYFSTHRTGFIFRRRVPVAQMMTWQKVRMGDSVMVQKVANTTLFLLGTADVAIIDAESYRCQGGGENLQGHPADHGRP